jgi:hypothetical protein
MASIKNYVNGVGGSDGAELATIAPLQASGTIYYLGNATSGASDSNSGTERAKPLLTMAQAYANASAGDIIDVLAGHNEILSTVVTFNKAKLSVIGEGSGSTVPSFTMNDAGDNAFAVTADGCLFDNLQFAVPTSTGTTMNVAALATLKNLTFRTGSLETASLSLSNASSGSFVSGLTVTATVSGAAIAVLIPGAITIDNITMDNIVIDAGSFSWATYAMQINTALRLNITNLQLLNGSDVIVPTGSTGYIHVSEQSGSSNIAWTV